MVKSVEKTFSTGVRWIIYIQAIAIALFLIFLITLIPPAYEEAKTNPKLLNIELSSYILLFLSLALVALVLKALMTKTPLDIVREEQKRKVSVFKILFGLLLIAFVYFYVSITGGLPSPTLVIAMILGVVAIVLVSAGLRFLIKKSDKTNSKLMKTALAGFFLIVVLLLPGLASSIIKLGYNPNDISECNARPDITSEYNCIERHARETNDPSICNAIDDYRRKMECVLYEFPQNFTDCQFNTGAMQLCRNVCISKNSTSSPYVDFNETVHATVNIPYTKATANITYCVLDFYTDTTTVENGTTVLGSKTICYASCVV